MQGQVNGCRLCSNAAGLSGKALATHVQMAHRMTCEEYSWRHLLALPERPCCAVTGCLELPRYGAWQFKRYCRSHSSVAESEAGRVGGRKKATWNRGKTAADDPRIRGLLADANPFYGKKHAAATLEALATAKRLSESEIIRRVVESVSGKYFEPRLEYSTYRGWQVPFSVACRYCGEATERCLMDLERGTRCHQCFPIGSLQETEVAEFVKSLGFDVLRNDREAIRPLELDILLPAASLAIEYDGLYWHSGGKSADAGMADPYSPSAKKRSRAKYLACVSAGLRLVQLYSDEWMGKRQICESMLMNRLGRSPHSVGARECAIAALDSAEGRAFLDKCHISGATKSSVYLGLRHPELGLVSVLSLRKPVQGKYGNVLEVARFASELGTQVQGAAGRLIGEARRLSRDHGFTGLLSYADLRFGGSGGVYAKCGFERLPDTGPNYAYTDGRVRFDRFRFRASGGRSEREVAAAAGVKPVYGPGHAVYLMKF